MGESNEYGYVPSLSSFQLPAHLHTSSNIGPWLEQDEGGDA
jgi:hypothetical protein